jgi:uncharacterized membrane protein
MNTTEEADVVSQDLTDPPATFGERVADRVAAFGGSWRFIISFGIVLLGWILINSVWLIRTPPFDPYPFILLNLVLSCLAALQAPVIMMSQNRQEAKDRQRAQNDYLINLKAELEIRSLHQKLDALRQDHSVLLDEVRALLNRSPESATGPAPES